MITESLFKSWARDLMFKLPCTIRAEYHCSRDASQRKLVFKAIVTVPNGAVGRFSCGPCTPLAITEWVEAQTSPVL